MVTLPLSPCSSVDHAGGFIRPHAGHRLVEQKKPRLCRERHGDFELPVLAMAQFADSRCGATAEPDPRQRRLRGLAQFVVAAGFAPEPERMAAMRLHRERDIVERGEIGKQRGDLERPRQTEPAAADRPAARVMSPPAKRMWPAAARSRRRLGR